MSISIESERDSASTARRKRAEEWLNGDNQITVEESDWARGLTGNFDDDYGVLIGYLAGSQEEAARAAAKLRAAAAETRTPFGEQLLRLADEIEEGR